MDFRDVASADLPAPRDDEPDSLRADILAEIEDHLECAYRRELLRGMDRESAQQCALDRFGDPAALARRLWLDEVKGKIMSRRVLVVTCIVLAAVCLAMVALMGIQTTRAERQAAMANARLAVELRQAQLVQTEMLKKLEAMSKAAESPRSPDWIPVSFRLTEEARAGTPAANVQVSLGRGRNGSMKDDAIQRTSTEDGLVDFGVVQPGDWEYQLVSPPNSGEPTWMATGTLSALPGTKIEKTIICPKQQRSSVILRPKVDWPADLAGKNLVLCAQIQHMGLTYQAPLTWTTGGFIWDVFIGPEAGQAHRFNGLTMFFWQLAAPEPKDADASPPVFAEVRGWDTAKAVAEASGWVRGGYRLTRLVVLQPLPSPALPKASKRYRLLAYASSSPTSPDPQYVFEKPPDDGTDPSVLPNGIGQQSHAFVTLPTSLRRLSELGFTADENWQNEWTIPLSDELVQAVREKLKAQEVATKK
jgi:hypothetical protein